MRLKYDKPNNLFEFVYDSNYIMGNKKRLLKTKKYPFSNILRKNIVSFVGYIILLIISILSYIKTEFILFKFMSYIIILFILMMGLSFGTFIYMYFKTKNDDFKGSLVIDENGITDEDDNSKITIKWETILCVIIGNHSINIFLKNRNMYFRVPTDKKEKLIGAIEKYSNVEIIDLTNNK